MYLEAKYYCTITNIPRWVPTGDNEESVLVKQGEGLLCVYTVCVSVRIVSNVLSRVRVCVCTDLYSERRACSSHSPLLCSEMLVWLHHPRWLITNSLKNTHNSPSVPTRVSFTVIRMHLMSHHKTWTSPECCRWDRSRLSCYSHRRLTQGDDGIPEESIQNKDTLSRSVTLTSNKTHDCFTCSAM